MQAASAGLAFHSGQKHLNKQSAVDAEEESDDCQPDVPIQHVEVGGVGWIRWKKKIILQGTPFLAMIIAFAKPRQLEPHAQRSPPPTFLPPATIREYKQEALVLFWVNVPMSGASVMMRASLSAKLCSFCACSVFCSQSQASRVGIQTINADKYPRTRSFPHNQFVLFLLQDKPVSLVKRQAQQLCFTDSFWCCCRS